MKLNNIDSTISIIDQIVKSFGEDKTLTVAFLGYHDAMSTMKEWKEVTGKNTSALESRPNAEKLIDIHGRRKDVTICPTIKSWLSCAYEGRVTHTVFDFTKYEGEEVEHDFNYPLPSRYDGQFDIVIDIGTSEHIFNIPQAFINVLKMTKNGGVIFHVGPVCMPNHGFYGYNPTLFADFYEANMCRIIDMDLRTQVFDENGDRQILKVGGVPKYGRFRLAEVFKQNPNLNQLEYNLNCLVRKEDSVSDIVYPIQQKYRDKELWR